MRFESPYVRKLFEREASYHTLYLYWKTRDRKISANYLKGLKATRKKLIKLKRYGVYHKNPVATHMRPPRRTRIAKIALKIAFKLYKHFKNTGVPRFVIDRIPTDFRPYVVDILRYNGVRVVESNPTKSVKQFIKKELSKSLKKYRYFKQHGFSKAAKIVMQEIKHYKKQLGRHKR